MHVATPRLIEASSVLDPASQALLNLWLHRGLSDDAIAELAGLDLAVIAARRLEIVTRLGAELGVRPYDVLLALAQIVHPPQEHGPGDPGPELNGGPPGGAPDASEAVMAPDASEAPEATDTVPASEETPAAPAASLAPAAPAEEAAAPGRRRALAVIAVLAAAVVAVVVVVLVISDGGSHGSAQRAADPTTDAGATSVSTASPVPASDGSSEALAPLSSRAPDASGSVAVTGVAGARKLTVTVSGLPPLTGTHYEVWLYKTIIDAHALGRIGTGVTQVSLSLPADAARYPAIDISVQPPHYAYDSGESVLRGKNPLG